VPPDRAPRTLARALEAAPAEPRLGRGGMRRVCRDRAPARLARPRLGARLRPGRPDAATPGRDSPRRTRAPRYLARAGGMERGSLEYGSGISHFGEPHSGLGACSLGGLRRDPPVREPILAPPDRVAPGSGAVGRSCEPRLRADLPPNDGLLLRPARRARALPRAQVLPPVGTDHRDHPRRRAGCSFLLARHDATSDPDAAVCRLGRADELIVLGGPGPLACPRTLRQGRCRRPAGKAGFLNTEQPTRHPYIIGKGWQSPDDAVIPDDSASRARWIRKLLRRPSRARIPIDLLDDGYAQTPLSGRPRSAARSRRLSLPSFHLS